MKKALFLLILVLSVAVLSGCNNSDQSGNSGNGVVNENAAIIFFYGKTCPHCKNVEDFFVENKVEDKIQFEKAEVYGNKANAEIMKKKAEVCKLDANNLGVPMLWSDGQCRVGDKDIIKFFEDKIK